MSFIAFVYMHSLKKESVCSWCATGLLHNYIIRLAKKVLFGPFSDRETLRCRVLSYIDNQMTLKGSKCSKSVLYFSTVGLEVRFIQDMDNSASFLWLHWCFIHAKTSDANVLWLCIVIRPHKGKAAFGFPARTLKSKGLKGKNKHSSLHRKKLICILEQESFFKPHS